MAMLPKEHGAYGYVAFPLVTAFGVAGPSTAGLLIAVAAIAGFLGHEPLAVLLGLRGVRARREQGREAARWGIGCLAVGTIAGVAALLTIAPSARWWLLLPALPAAALAAAIGRGQEKTSRGESAAALAFSATAVPVALAGGAPVSTALAIAIPFAVLFVGGTLAVRVVILRRRGGGDPRAAARTRRAAYLVVGTVSAALALAITLAMLPAASLVAAAPGLLMTAAIAAFPPSPAKLRALGWTLVAASMLTLVVAVVALR